MAFCSRCGAQAAESAAFCANCGAALGAPAAAYAVAQGPWHASQGDGENRSFIGAIRLCLRKYAIFTGRAPRAEYWWWELAQFIIIGVLVALAIPGIIDYFNAVSAYSHDKTLPMPELNSPWFSLEQLYSLAMFLPGLAVQVRRLHDTNRSGWWVFIGLVPLVGPILMLVWLCTRGTRGLNKYGADPLPANV